MHRHLCSKSLGVLLACASLAAAFSGCTPSDGETTPPRIELALDAVHLFETDDILGEVRALHTSATGEVWVLSKFDPYVYRFDREGRLLDRFGRQGGGPGELRNPWALTTLPDDPTLLAVWDVGKRQLVFFDQGGAIVRTSELPLAIGSVRADIKDVSYGDPFQMRSGAGGLLVQYPAGTVAHTRDYYRSLLVRVDADGAVRDTVVNFGGLRPHPLPGSAQVPVPLWTTCSDHRAVLFDPAGRTLQWLTDDDPSEPVSLPIENRRFTELDVVRYFTHVLDREAREANVVHPDLDGVVRRTISSNRAWFERDVPPAVDVLCDGERVWINTFSTADDPLGYGPEWRVFAGSAHVATLVFPTGFRPVDVRDDRAVGIITDEDGLQRPASIDLPSRG